MFNILIDHEVLTKSQDRFSTCTVDLETIGVFTRERFIWDCHRGLYNICKSLVSFFLE